MANTTPTKSGLFSSLTLPRAAKPSRSSETLAHPLLGASTSSSNLNLDSSNSSNDTGGNVGLGISTSPSNPSLSPTVATSVPWKDGPSSASSSLPYKPRQRHQNSSSIGSANSILTPSLSTPQTSNVTDGTSAALDTTSTPSSDADPPSSQTMDPSSSSSISGAVGTGAGSATSKLQLQSLKASAQKIGLGNGSMGMSMIDGIFERSQASVVRNAGKGPDEWGTLLKVLMAGKAVLLLPISPSSSLPISPQILRDHVAFLSPPIPLDGTSRFMSRSSDSISGKGKEVMHESISMAVTLSGLVGYISKEGLVFESVLDTHSPIMKAIREPSTRSAALASLRPTTVQQSNFPTYLVSSESAIFPFPALGKGGSAPTSETDKSRVVSGGRLGRINPFASFWAGSTPASATDPSNLTVDRPISPSKLSDRPASPGITDKPASLVSETSPIHSDSPDKDPEGFSILGYTITKPIRAAEVQKSLAKALKSQVKNELSRLPEKVMDDVTRLLTQSVCPTIFDPARSPAKSKDIKDIVPLLDFSNPSETGEEIQIFIEQAYDALLLHYQNDSSGLFLADGKLKRKTSGSKWDRSGGKKGEGLLDTEIDGASKEKRRRLKEERAEREASEGTERVEAIVTRLLYNRQVSAKLFSPLESDDARHDEALASRIAALNLLDLSLDHLGLVTRPEDEADPGVIAEALKKIVDDVGQELQKLGLPTCLTPKEKTDILVQAHQLVVDGLADLPPIPLRPEGEVYRPPSPIPSPTIALTEEHPALTTPQPITAPTSALQSASSRDQSVSREVKQPDSSRPSSKSLSSASSRSASFIGSPAPSDPLSITDEIDKTPQPFAPGSATVPHLQLDKMDDSTQLQEAMADSVLTVRSNSKASSRSPSVSSQNPTGIKEKKITSSGADQILPIIIYAVVKANPPQLASQLMYLRRYRSAISLTGEASYAIVNLTAVVEFLEHVELSQLGLQDDEGRVMSIADLSPIGLNYLDEGTRPNEEIASASDRLRGRVFQVLELANTAADSGGKLVNGVTGVIDSSWSAVRGLISSPLNNADGQIPDHPSVDENGNVEGLVVRPSQGRQASAFSLANVTASVASIAAAAAATTAAARSRANSRILGDVNEEDKSGNPNTWQGNQEMMDVSRPASIKEKLEYPSDSDSATDDSEDETTEEGRSRIMRTISNTSNSDPFGSVSKQKVSDTRSIKSVSSMLSKEGRKEESRMERVSLSDRLANIGGFAKPVGQPVESPSLPMEKDGSKGSGFLSNIAGMARTASATSNKPRRGSLLGMPESARTVRSGSVSSLQNAGAPLITIDPPVERFMTCDVGDIRLSEIGELLRDYRRLGSYINSINKGQFD